MSQYGNIAYFFKYYSFNLIESLRKILSLGNPLKFYEITADLIPSVSLSDFTGFPMFNLLCCVFAGANGLAVR